MFLSPLNLALYNVSDRRSIELEFLRQGLEISVD